MRFFIILGFFLFFLGCHIALAADNNISGGSGGKKNDIVSGVICNIVTTLNGPISQAIETLVIIITGYSFFVGKVSIGMLFIVTAGIMFVFGAQTIMGLILGNDNAELCKGKTEIIK